MRAFSFSGLIKRLLFGLLLLLLIFPACQARWAFLDIRPLDGYFQLTEAPGAITWAELAAGRYQDQLEHYLNDRLGFREWLIRLRNQVEFSLFKKLHVNDTVLGQNGVLFQTAHIASFLGDDYIGDDEIKFYVQRLRLVQDDLAKRGIQLLCVLAPGKPRYQPEDLPSDSKAVWPKPTNYSALAREQEAAGVQTFDAVQLFQHWKPKASHPLFPRGGTHWSGYSITLVADTLFRRLEALGHYDMRDFHSSPGVVTTQDLRFTDNDIAKSLNLIWEPAPYPMAYPAVTFKPLTSTQHLPNVLLVGDSFAQSFYGFYPYLSNLLDSRSRFWYYNETTFWPEKTPPGEERNVRKLNLQEQLQGREAIILVATEQNLNRTSFGFVDQVYHLYHPYTAADTSRLLQIKEAIMQSQEWREKVQRKAETQQISVEEALANEAYYMRERER